MLYFSTFIVLLLSCVVIPRTLAVSNSSKAGMAWPNGNWDDIKQYTFTGKVSWCVPCPLPWLELISCCRYYTWSPSSISSSLEFVPMLWSDRQISQWESSINQTIRNLGVTHVLGFNEPEYPSQANMTPSHGASLWKAQIEPLRSQGVRLGSPAPTSDPAGKQWLLDWLTACDSACTVDFIALHWYDINSTAFTAYLEDFHETFQRPLWVTEWACQVREPTYVMS